MSGATITRPVLLLQADPAAGGVALLSLVGTDWNSVRLLPLAPLYDRIPRLIEGLPGSGVPRATALFHPREVGAAMALLLPLPIVFLLFGRGWRLRLLAGAVALPALVVLALSQALMGLFGLAMALCLILIWWRRWLASVLLLGATAMVGAVLTAGPHALALALLDVQHPLGIGFALRFDMWSRALAMIRDTPLTGIGLNTFSLVQSHFYTGYIIGPEVHAHNLYLQTALDLGLPGLLAFLLLVAAFYGTVYGAYRRTESRQVQLLLVGLAAGVLAYLAGGALDVMTLGAKPVAALWLMFGLAGAAWQHTTEVRQSRLGRGWGLPD